MSQCWYHDNCMDGFTAAWAVYRVHPDWQFVPVRYNEPPPAYNSEDQILIVDFSYPEKELQTIKERVKLLEVIDHHKTAPSGWIASNGCFDLGHSGAWLTWRWMFPHYKPPELVKYVEDRDLWNWKLPNSKEINAFIGSFDFSFDIWDSLNDDWNSASYALRGIDILRAQDRYIKSILKNRHFPPDPIYDADAYAVNSPIFQSELGNELAKLTGGFGAVYWYDKDGKRNYSLRSIGELDVAAIAKNYGGGGHKNAAGFKL